MKFKNPGMRLGIVCLAAASGGLSLVIISISKVLLVIAVLPALLSGKRPGCTDAGLNRMGAGQWT